MGYGMQTVSDPYKCSLSQVLSYSLSLTQTLTCMAVIPGTPLNCGSRRMTSQTPRTSQRTPIAIWENCPLKHAQGKPHLNF